MSHIPLPTTSAIKKIATFAPSPMRPWLRSKLSKLDPFSFEDGDPSISTCTNSAGNDTITKEHEAEEHKRRIEEKAKMNVVSVPVLSDERSYGGGKGDKASTRKRRYYTPPTSPVKTAPNLSPERMSVPTLPSPMSSPFLLAGSEFLVSTKVRISPRSKERVARELKEAVESEVFKIWPTLEDPRPGWEVKELDVSGVYQRELGEEERERREELLREWRLKGEREREVRGRRSGAWKEGEGWESVVIGQRLRDLWGFAPTLGLVREDGDWEGRGMEIGNEKRELVKESTRTPRREPAREREVLARRDHREHKPSRAGKGKNAEADRGDWMKEDRLTHLRSQTEPTYGPKIGSSRDSSKTSTTFRPWEKDREGKENSEDDYVFDLKPRKT